MSNEREQEIKDNFINIFVQSLQRVYLLCEEESHWFTRSQNHARTAAYAGMSYWVLRNISSIPTPYGNYSCDPASFILCLACCRAFHDEHRAAQSGRLVSFLESAEACKNFSKSTAEALFQRFRFVIPLLVNGDDGVGRLATFFVDAIAAGLALEPECARSEKLKRLVELALPERGNAVYFRHCLEKKIKLKDRTYIIPSDNNGYQVKFHFYFSIMGLITTSPAFCGNDFYIREGTGGELIYPPQELICNDARFTKQRWTFDSHQYSQKIVIFSSPYIDRKEKLLQLKGNIVLFNETEVTDEQLSEQFADICNKAIASDKWQEKYKKSHPVTSFFYIPRAPKNQRVKEQAEVQMHANHENDSLQSSAAIPSAGNIGANSVRIRSDSDELRDMFGDIANDVNRLITSNNINPMRY